MRRDSCWMITNMVSSMFGKEILNEIAKIEIHVVNESKIVSGFVRDLIDLSLSDSFLNRKEALFTLSIIC